MTKGIDGRCYIVTNEDGLILSVMVDWRLGLAQTVAKVLQDAIGENTYLHHCQFADDQKLPTVGMSTSMNGTKLVF